MKRSILLRSKPYYLSILLFLIFCSGPLNAQNDSIVLTTNPIEPLESYLDSLVAEGMKSYHVPGVTIAVVTDSQFVFTKAYGLANIEDNIKVDKEKTGFRIASITKTFTALAAMQLVEQGKLDLHKPIEIYLPDDDFDFLDDKPFTAHQLLTHTAGFDLTDTGDAALRVEDVIPLEELARHQMPDQVHDPGTVHSYSNFGYALMGYLIQEISGMRYEDYIRENILKPLGMLNTDLTQPLPDKIKTNLARSYVWNDEQIYLPRDYTNTTPGGGIVSNADDMSKYMLMLLNAGQLDDVELLSPEYFEMLTSQQYGSKQTKYGVCYAFFENMWTTRRSLDHTGGQLGFVSLMTLIPETGTGIFIAQNNRKNAGRFRYDVMIPLLDTLLGEKKREIPKLIPPDNFDTIAKNYTGRYKQKNYPKATFEKLSRFFGAFTTEYWVSYKGEGIMDIRGTEYIMIDEHLFQMNDQESTHKMEFKVDDKGKAQELMIGTTSYERVPWYKFKRVLQFSLIVSMIMLLFHVIVSPIRRIIRKRRKNAVHNNPRAKWITKWYYRTALLYVVGTAGVAIVFAYYQDQMSDYGVPLILKLILLIYTIAFILACLSPIVLWKSITNKSLGTIDRMKDLILIAAIVVTSLTLFHFNMIGFQYY